MAFSQRLESLRARAEQIRSDRQHDSRKLADAVGRAIGDDRSSQAVGPLVGKDDSGGRGRRWWYCTRSLLA